MSNLKAAAAKKALDFIDDHWVVGVGTGSTVIYFIEALAGKKHQIEAAVASSLETEKRLRALNIPVLDLNVVDKVDVYIDGADEVNQNHEMIKGGGGALTREKIVATSAEAFVCIVDETKVVSRLGNFPVAIEVIPMARSLVGRAIVQMGGNPMYRENFITDNGNILLDVYDLELENPLEIEKALNTLPGVVENGIFAACKADRVVVSGNSGIETW